MKRGPIIVVIFIVLAAVVVGASQFLRAQPPLEITVAVSPLVQDWVSSAAQSFNASAPLVNATRRVLVHVSAVDDIDVWSGDGSTQWTADNHPQAWIPAATASLGYASRLAFEVVQPSVAKTVLMWGGFGDRVDALTDKAAHPLDWTQVASAATAGTWAQVPGAQASWGNVSLAFSRPDRSMGGLSVLFSGAAAFSQQASVAGTTFTSNDFRNWMSNILLSVPNYNTLGASVAGTMAARGVSAGEMALLPESEWLTHLGGRLTDSADPIRFSYPTYEFVFDFPLARWQGMTTDEDTAVAAFAQYLLRQTPESSGLRPPSGSPDETARLFAQAANYGALLQPDLSQAVPAPALGDTQRLLSWVGQTVR